MAILVTGGAGYIGSVTVEMLVQHGERVVVLDNLSRGHRAAVTSSARFYQGSIGDRSLIERIVNDEQVDSCIHFAALAYVGESVTEPARYFENNVEQAIRLLGALVNASVKQFVFSSTCATYGEPEQIPMGEDHPRRPTSPYGLTKLIIEQVLETYQQAYGMRFVALRYFNAAGATEACGEHHEPETHLIPNVLSAAEGNSPRVSVFGDKYPTADGTAVRDYVHVSDLASAHLLAMKHLRSGGRSDFLNLGTGTGYSVLEVIDAARSVTGRSIEVEFGPPRSGDPSHLVAKADRSLEVLGWRPIHSDLAQIIGSAWEWRKKHPAGYSE